MQSYNAGYMQQLPQPNQPYPAASMPAQLEDMFPKSYYIIQPAVDNACNMIAASYGQGFAPSQTQLESMIDGIYDQVESDVQAAVQESPYEVERQFYGGDRRLLRDFIGALLISSLIRRRPYYVYPPYYGYYNFYGYPGGYYY
jgi:hypothetical protein